ncbi:hypothetical protein [Leisingera sp. ANG-S]|uniref:hypothetical protein n=1 Tax=Leisingera sp. ANG-S TaxID=1577898 RepID=UPI0019D36681|nr:hypothetical protein [Leisingera sp. ANG-S]
MRAVYPNSLETIWSDLGFTRRLDIAFSPSIFTVVSDRAALLNLFVARQDEIQPAWMGDKTIAQLVFALNRHWSAPGYRLLSRLTGLSRN